MIKTFQKKIEVSTGKKLILRVTDNRSTMLSVKWQPDCTRLSMHRMFLQAPDDIIEELCCYVIKGEKKLTPTIKAYIEDNMKHLDYSHLLDKSKLCTSGKVYDLQVIYDEINKEYFNNELKLSITWYAQAGKKSRNRVTFGLYHEPLKLIKVHKMLDSHDFPEFFVYYVVYHEMLHYVCPAYVDAKGLSHIHNKEFKAREIEFRYFTEAQQWIKNNIEQIFAA